MPRFKDERPAVRVYTVCDESKYLIVRNVPALGCGDELQLLFAKYGEVEECKPMDAEECEPFTDVYWIKFCQINNARFAKRKLDEFAFLGHRLQISYAPNYESLSDTKEKLEGRRKEVLARLNPGNSERYGSQYAGVISDPLSARSMPAHVSYYSGCNQSWDAREPDHTPQRNHARVSSNEDYFTSESMNETVHQVRDKLKEIGSSSSHIQPSPPPKKPRVDNRRRI